MISATFIAHCDGKDCGRSLENTVASVNTLSLAAFERGADRQGWMFVNNGQCYCPMHTKTIINALQKTAKEGA